jgi:hypothetical protein
VYDALESSSRRAKEQCGTSWENEKKEETQSVTEKKRQKKRNKQTASGDEKQPSNQERIYEATKQVLTVQSFISNNILIQLKKSEKRYRKARKEKGEKICKQMNSFCRYERGIKQLFISADQ